MPVFGENSLILPPLVNLSASAIASTGVYLLDDGLSLTLILGSQPSQAEMMDLFGVPSLDGYDITNLSLPALENDRSQRVRTLINELRLGRPYFCPLKIVRVTDVDFGRVKWKLIEDRDVFQGGNVSYAEYVQLLVGGKIGY